MKKYARWFMILLTVMAMVAVFTVCASAAEPVQEGGHWVINADKIDEILAEEAGEKTTGWEVPFLKVSPTLDGTISKAEYQPFEMYEDYLSYQPDYTEKIYKMGKLLHDAGYAFVFAEDLLTEEGFHYAEK